MSGDQLNLDAILERAAASASLVGFTSIHGTVSREDVPALVAEVRRLRGRVDDLTLVANGSVVHRFMGDCPDSLDGHDNRDPVCVACAVLDAP